MVLVFDLDDTLYEERTFVLSGFRAVARWGEEQFGQDAESSFHELVQRLDREGRGKIFNGWLRKRAPVRNAIRVYRHHTPDIHLPESSRDVLDRYSLGDLYMVTDGHKIVQANKVRALGLGPWFDKIYLTHRYGRTRAKPALYCFDLIRRRQSVRWGDIIYVGDDPAKDFVSLNGVGALTIRVLTGRNATVAARTGFDARHRLPGLRELPGLLAELGLA